MHLQDFLFFNFNFFFKTSDFGSKDLSFILKLALSFSKLDYFAL